MNKERGRILQRAVWKENEDTCTGARFSLDNELVPGLKELWRAVLMESL